MSTKASISEHARRLGLHAKTLWRGLRVAGITGERYGQAILISRSEAAKAAAAVNSRPGRPRK